MKEMPSENKAPVWIAGDKINEVQFCKMNAEYTAEHYFAALKLIEQLYKDGEIPAYMFRNILKDYADVVDLSKFAIFEEKEDAA